MASRTSRIRSAAAVLICAVELGLGVVVDIESKRWAR
jgi:hypothetical protein